MGVCIGSSKFLFYIIILYKYINIVIFTTMLKSSENCHEKRLQNLHVFTLKHLTSRVALKIDF